MSWYSHNACIAAFYDCNQERRQKNYSQKDITTILLSMSAMDHEDVRIARQDAAAKSEFEDSFEDSDSESYHDTADSPSQCIEKDIIKALQAKEIGNSFYRDKNFDEAIQAYSRAVSLCPDDDLNRENLSIFYANRAAAYFAVDEFDQVIEDCSRSLERNDRYIKVLLRRCQAYEKLEKIEEALSG